MASGPQIVIKEKGAALASLHLHELGVRASDVRRVAPKIKGIFAKAERRRFDREGPGWPPLADSTVERKQRMGQPRKRLRATNALFESLTTAGRGRSNQVDKRERSTLSFGTSLPYAIFHEEGKGVPERQIIELTLTERREMAKAIEKYVGKGEER